MLGHLEQLKIWVAKLLDSVEGGTGMLHNITKLGLWRGRAPFIEDVRAPAGESGGDAPEHSLEDKLWEHGALQDLEQALQSMGTED